MRHLFSRGLHLVLVFAVLNLSVFPVWGGLGDEADYRVSVSRHVSKQRTALGESLHIDITFKDKKDDVFKGENTFRIVRPLFYMDAKGSRIETYSGMTEVFDGRKGLTAAERRFLSHVPQFKALFFNATGALCVRGLKDRRHVYCFESDGEILFEDTVLKEVALSARSVNVRGRVVMGRLFSNLQDSRGSFQVFRGAFFELVSGTFKKGSVLNRGTITSKGEQTLDLGDGSFFNEGRIESEYGVDLQNVKVFENHGNVKVLRFKLRGREFQNHSKIEGTTLDVMTFERFRNEGEMVGKSLRVISLADFYNAGNMRGRDGQKIITQGDFLNAGRGELSSLDLEVEAFGQVINLGQMAGQRSRLVGRKRFYNRGKIEGEFLRLRSLGSFVEEGESRGGDVLVVSPETEFKRSSVLKAEVFSLETEMGEMLGRLTAKKFLGEISKSVKVGESAVFSLEDWTLKGKGACFYRGKTSQVCALVFEEFGAFINEEDFKVERIEGECGRVINLRALEASCFKVRLEELKNEGALKGREIPIQIEG